MSFAKISSGDFIVDWSRWRRGSVIRMSFQFHDKNIDKNISEATQEMPPLRKHAYSNI